MVIVLTDEAALAAVAAGDEQAFGLLWSRYGGAVLTAAQRILRHVGDAEDVTQDVFQTIWRRASAFDPQRGDAGGWIHAIARNRALDVARRRREAVSPDAVPEPADPAPGVPEQVGEAEEAFRIHRALEGLDAELRQLVHLAYVDGLSQSEIAERLGWPLGTVKTRTRRALARLADELAQTEEVSR